VVVAHSGPPQLTRWEINKLGRVVIKASAEPL
jgi:hypothetical protein